MTVWRLLLRGDNFPVETQEGAQLMGFFATRWVDAVDEEEAFKAAVALLREAPELTGVPEGCGANIVSEEITRLNHGQIPLKREELTFFRMATSSA